MMAHQMENVSTARPTTMGTKTEDTVSAKAWMGALDSWALSTKRTIWARAVSDPTCVACTCMLAPSICRKLCYAAQDLMRQLSAYVVSQHCRLLAYITALAEASGPTVISRSLKSRIDYHSGQLSTDIIDVTV